MDFYSEYRPLLEQVERELLCEITGIVERTRHDEVYARAEHIHSRIKSEWSAREKLEKKGYSPNPKNALAHLSDLIGIRVVTHFIGDVYALLEEIQTSKCWRVVKVKDYIANPKPNGYRSLHVIVQMQGIHAEIQLRTIAMDCWASLEHRMRYKKDIPNTHLISSELARCAAEMASTDLTMQTILAMIQRKEET